MQAARRLPRSAGTSRRRGGATARTRSSNRVVTCGAPWCRGFKGCNPPATGDEAYAPTNTNETTEKGSSRLVKEDRRWVRSLASRATSSWARLELVADIKVHGQPGPRRSRLIVPLLFIGYAFALRGPRAVSWSPWLGSAPARFFVRWRRAGRARRSGDRDRRGRALGRAKAHERDGAHEMNRSVAAWCLTALAGRSRMATAVSRMERGTYPSWLSIPIRWAGGLGPAGPEVVEAEQEDIARTRSAGVAVGAGRCGGRAVARQTELAAGGGTPPSVASSWAGALSRLGPGSGGQRLGRGFASETGEQMIKRGRRTRPWKMTGNNFEKAGPRHRRADPAREFEEGQAKR